MYDSSPPVTEVTAAIEVEAGTLTFRVRCTSTGGRALNMAVSGPNGYNSDISTNIQAVGTPLFLSNDRYTARTEVISSGMGGDEFKCNVTSVDSMTDVVTVEGNGPQQYLFLLLLPVSLQLLQLQPSIHWFKQLSLPSEWPGVHHLKPQ